jgi:hypothetical protein
MLAAGPALEAQSAPAQEPSRRDQVRMMEGVLTGAVRTGAEQLSRTMQSVEPNLVLLTGGARARGFVLDGYGVFFDVEIPAVRQSVAWSVRTLERDRQVGGALAAMRQTIAAMNDPQLRSQFQQVFQRLEREVAPVSHTAEPPARGTVAAAATGEPNAPPSEPFDPNQQYTAAVKAALIDAMIEYSGPMRLQPDEWFTVAARDSEGPLMPGELYDAATIVLRIKGSDLDAYRTGRATKAETLAKVEVREF